MRKIRILLRISAS